MKPSHLRGWCSCEREPHPGARRDSPDLVDVAVEAERAGFDGVMVSEHIVLGRGADADGVAREPAGLRPAGEPGPGDPVALVAAAARRDGDGHDRPSADRERGDPAASAPLQIAKELATLDLLSRGRLVVQPTVSWHRAEYEALGVAFETRGERLDEHLEAWKRLWRDSPVSFHGRHYAFDDVWLEPKAVPARRAAPVVRRSAPARPAAATARDLRPRLQPAGPRERRRPRAPRRGDGCGRPRLAELEMVGGTRGPFPDAMHPAPLDGALDQVPEQVERGFGTICIKPSQFTDDPTEIPTSCGVIVVGVEARVRRLVGSDDWARILARRGRHGPQQRPQHRCQVLLLLGIEVAGDRRFPQSLNFGNRSSIVARPYGVSSTITIRPSFASFRRVTSLRDSSVVITPVAVGRLMPTAAANSRASISPQTHSTHRPDERRPAQAVGREHLRLHVPADRRRSCGRGSRSPTSPGSRAELTRASSTFRSAGSRPSSPGRWRSPGRVVWLTPRSPCGRSAPPARVRRRAAPPRPPRWSGSSRSRGAATPRRR